MSNIKLKLQYDGTNYSGWQIQPKAATVEKVVTDCIERIFQEKIKLVGATRTDAGVHALGQTANFKTSRIDKMPSERQLLRSLNCLLPKDISVLEVETVDENFHSRFDAKGKIYKYQIWSSSVPSPFFYRYCWKIRYNPPLDLEAMNFAGKFLKGEKDFTSFQGAGCDAKTSVRRIDRVEFKNNGNILEIWIEGSGFLKYMVRNIVGTLVNIGRGLTSPEQMEHIINAKDRKAAGETAPAQGLYLMEVTYKKL
ncbi:MAG: tRNA pseudouridine synthase A [Candidatus Gottesmanbacteria bacterium GW2011_GWC2_39_8]|uniref:tRNA pseudouridine synthase A n=1 Tax=Candidatus Gottesmanbacteria bacterium GW2011_GWC2_39_8 TaxID=1618450 RepID=A0A0G0PY22_9BACT|nr:MAG: tRNA pseudouridine synthase A [Candidatus Gottesmanbacteria bacterium GW2011_GWC2_39_8]